MKAVKYAHLKWIDIIKQLSFPLLLILSGCEKIEMKHHFNKEEICGNGSKPLPVGRFQIVLGFDRSDTFLLDTLTGRVWSRALDPSRDGNAVWWSEEFVVNNLDSLTYDDFELMYPEKKTKVSDRKK